MTLREVAKRAQVSVSAVSDILNRNRASFYTEETRAKVRSAMTELGYVPERAAQSLRRGKSGAVGFVLTRGFLNPFFARLAETVDAVLAEYEIEMQLVLVSGRAERAEELARRLIGGGVDGVIAGPLYPWDTTLIEQLAKIDHSSLPLVVFGNIETDVFSNTVLLNDFAAGRLGVEYLLDRNHRFLGFLGSTPPSEEVGKTFSNQDGTERALKDHGLLEQAREWFVPIRDESSFSGFVEMAQGFVERWRAAAKGDRPTAMLCKNDLAGFAALAALSAAGVRVPEELSILGYDNTVEADYMSPPLTSVDQRIDSCVRAVVARIMAEIDPERVSDPVSAGTPFVNERASVQDC